MKCGAFERIRCKMGGVKKVTFRTPPIDQFLRLTKNVFFDNFYPSQKHQFLGSNSRISDDPQVDFACKNVKKPGFLGSKKGVFLPLF